MRFNIFYNFSKIFFIEDLTKLNDTKYRSVIYNLLKIKNGETAIIYSTKLHLWKNRGKYREFKEMKIVVKNWIYYIQIQDKEFSRYSYIIRK